jgi:hypothetical protein
MPLDAGLLKASDQTHLAYALRTGRAMGTYDADYIKLHSTGVSHAGIIYVAPRSRGIGNLIEPLLFL